MTWRDRLRPASFRGVEFRYDSVDSEVGRRTVVREFPNGTQPYSEDLGPRARRFTVEGYLLGDDYDIDRDRLVAAFETPGPGRLIHPYWGDRVVVLDGAVSFREHVGEGGKVSFSATFVDSGETLAPIRVRATPADLADDADAAAAALQSATGDTFATQAFLGYVADEASVLLVSSVSVLRTANGKIKGALGIADTVSDTLDQLEDEAEALVSTPTTLAARVQAAVAELMAAASKVDPATQALIDSGAILEAAASGGPLSDRFRSDLVLRVFRDLSAFGDDLDAVDVNTPQDQQQADNQQAFVELVKAAAAIEAARAAGDLIFDSFDDAVAYRDEVSDAIEALLPDLDVETFAKLSGLRAKLQQRLTSTAEDLPRVVTFTPPVDTPALVVAQRLYDDPSRDFEIIARNNPRHPAFLTGAVDLQVLADDS